LINWATLSFSRRVLLHWVKNTENRGCCGLRISCSVLSLCVLKITLSPSHCLKFYILSIETSLRSCKPIGKSEFKGYPEEFSNLFLLSSFMYNHTIFTFYCWLFWHMSRVGKLVMGISGQRIGKGWNWGGHAPCTRGMRFQYKTIWLYAVWCVYCWQQYICICRKWVWKWICKSIKKEGIWKISVLKIWRKPFCSCIS
jgi:hypothetical protein